MTSDCQKCRLSLLCLGGGLGSKCLVLRCEGCHKVYVTPENNQCHDKGGQIVIVPYPPCSIYGWTNYRFKKNQKIVYNIRCSSCKETALLLVGRVDLVRTREIYLRRVQE